MIYVKRLVELGEHPSIVDKYDDYSGRWFIDYDNWMWLEVGDYDYCPVWTGIENHYEERNGIVGKLIDKLFGKQLVTHNKYKEKLKLIDYAFVREDQIVEMNECEEKINET